MYNFCVCVSLLVFFFFLNQSFNRNTTVSLVFLLPGENHCEEKSVFQDKKGGNFFVCFFLCVCLTSINLIF